MNKIYTWLVEIISGRKNGVAPNLIRTALFSLSIVYGWIIQIRNWAYDRQIFKTRCVSAPVISIGNLTTGGTGKTPLVIWLAKQLQDQWGIVIVSRGFRAINTGLNDEGREIAIELPDVIQVQNRDRAQAASEILANWNDPQQAPLIILDDAFQHRAICRDVNIVVVDATNPFGFDFLLPRGLLREPLESLIRAHVVLITRTDLISPNQLQQIKTTIKNVNPSIRIFYTRLKIVGVKTTCGTNKDLSLLRDKRLFAFCAIGNPHAFRRTLQGIGALVGWMEFPDHYHFQQLDIDEIVDRSRRQHCDLIVCTQKDLVKLDGFTDPLIPIVAIKTHLHVDNAADFLEIVATTTSGIERSLVKPVS